MVRYAFGGGTGETPESIRRKRELANALMGRTKGAKNVGEGFNAIASGLVSRWNRDAANEAEQAGRESANDAFSRIVQGLTGGSGGYGTTAADAANEMAVNSIAANALAATDDDPVRRSAPPHIGQTDDMSAYQNAIASIESAGSGDYAAVGPTDPELGRALGRYQIMEANIGPWSREVLGREVTPEEFMASPEIQDAVFNGKFGQYVDQYGPEGAAQAWFAGPGGVGKMGREDSLGTSVSEYTNRFSSAMGGSSQGGGQGRVQVAQAGGGNLEELLMASQNPWLNDSQRSILNTMIEQELAAQQPAQPEYGFTQLDDGTFVRTDKTSGTVTPMGNFAAPEEGYRQLTSDEVAQYGLNPESAWQVGPDGKISEIGGSGVNVTTNVGDGSPGLGKLSTDYGYVVDQEGNPVIDPDTGLPKAAVVPGSATWREQQEAAEAEAAAAEAKQEQESKYGNVVSQDIERVRSLVKDSPWYSPTTGLGGAILKNMPASGAYDVGSLTDTIRANIGFDRLQQMRDASPTGGALGQVTERELNFLQSTLGNLDQAQSEEQFLYNLDRVGAIYERILRKAAAYPNASEFGFDAPPEDAGGQSRPEGWQNADQPPSDWEGDPELWQFMSPEDRALW